MSNDSTTETTTTEVTEVDSQPAATATGVDDNQPVTLAEARRLRRENQKLRAESKDAIAAAVAEAAEKARQEALDEARVEREELGRTLGKAFKLLPEDTEVAPDPEELVAQATSAAAEAQKLAADREATARAARVELEVFRLAASSGADANALLDSRSFLSSIAEVDPFADGARDALQAAIDRAVDDNPRLALAPTAPARSGGDMSGGNGDPGAGGPEPTDVDSLRARRAKRRANR